LNCPGSKTKRRISCIPEGEYFLRKRYSGKYGWHLELVAVKNRSLILIHPANNALQELNGCIAPVTKLCGPGLGLQSRKAFAKLKRLVYGALDSAEKVKIIVQS
jgi:hypothetical protein